MASEDVKSPPSSKRFRLSGAATYGIKFNSEWTAQYPFISKGHQDPVYSFYCQVCQKNFSCRHQGIADVRRHSKSGSCSCFMFEFDINLCKNCDLRAAQRVPISKFSWGGACPQTPLGGHAYTCHGLTPGIHHSLAALVYSLL